MLVPEMSSAERLLLLRDWAGVSCLVSFGFSKRFSKSSQVVMTSTSLVLAALILFLSFGPARRRTVLQFISIRLQEGVTVRLYQETN